MSTATFTAAELAQMRLHAEELLPSTCTIQARSTAPDGMGGVTVTWTNTTSVPCRLDAVTSLGTKSSATSDKFTIHDAWTLFVHWDRAIVVGNRVTFDGDTYEVLAVEDDHDWRLLRQATLQRVNA